MYILSLDSTAIAATVALCDDEKLLSLTTVENGNTHSQTLLPMVEQTLARFELRPTDVEMYACSAGPGSFTGVRIGVSTIKGLGFGRNIPCIGVSTLEALAYNLIGMDGLICPVMNARRNQVYNALFDCRDGVLTRRCDDRAIALTELDDELSAMGARPVYLVGDGYELDAIAATALGGTSMSGGRGKITGTIAGVLIIAVLNNGMNIMNISSYYQQVVKAVVILVAVLSDRKR